MKGDIDLQRAEVGDSVSRTALIVAAKRAIESQREDRLFDDPYAAQLAGEEVDILLERWRQVSQSQGVALETVINKRTRFVAVRTRFVDDVLQSVVPHVEQVVILGAGMDTRAFRLPWLAKVRLYEVDRPEVMAHKAALLQGTAAHCERHVIPCDLSESWLPLLINQGYRAEQKTVWLLEGVLMYLPEIMAHGVLSTISTVSAPGSYVVMDLVTTGSVEFGTHNEGRVRQNWQFGTDDPTSLLQQYGWQASVAYPGDEGVDFGRYPEGVQLYTGSGERGTFLVKASRGG